MPSTSAEDCRSTALTGIPTASCVTFAGVRQEAIFYPVVQMITGTTPNGGGTWKYVLHGHEQGLLRRNLAVMVQALHFKDYHLSARALRKWCDHPLREHYGPRLTPAGPYTVNYTGEIFFDSGGFTFMFGAPQGLEKYGLAGDDVQEELLRLKIALGADKLASLDYPIPPGLEPKVARERLEKTKKNALNAAKFLAEHRGDSTPGLVLPVHGSSAVEAGRFTADLVQTLEAEGLLGVVKGLGLGSMVPLRRSHRTPEIVSYVQEVHQAAPELPLHVFGVTGLLVPFLMHAGATSFDSSNYIQKARVLKYILPGYGEDRLPKMGGADHYPCSCAVCSSRDLQDDQHVMAAPIEKVERGAKSQVYAALALHNLEMDFQILELAKQHQAAETLPEYMQELSYRYPRMRQLLVGKMPKPAKRRKAPVNVETAYDVRSTRYRPQQKILLLLPCASEKPYTAARSFQVLWKALLHEIGPGVEQLEVVFVSGLYGPVPRAHVTRPPVMRYDYLLAADDKPAIDRVHGRLEDFLKRHQGQFVAKLAYLAPPAYRKAAAGLGLEMFPHSNASKFSHYQSGNLKQLAGRIRELLVRDGPPQPLLTVEAGGRTDRAETALLPEPPPLCRMEHLLVGADD